MSEADKVRWNQRYAAGEYDMTPNPRLVAHLTGQVRPGMVALDLACGAGRNAIWLAEQGAEVHAWDLSDEALGLLQAEAAQRGVAVHCRQVDLDQASLPEQSFDLVVDTNFLMRPLLEPMLRALKPGGLLFVDTFMASEKRAAVNPAYKLDPGELARVYGDAAEILHLYEDFHDGRATMLARRPATREAAPPLPT
ncbi:MAG: class I SAM-dependent methyltransferase [Bacillota bacterium]